MDQLNLCWLAGLLEGEGSFMKGSPSKPNSPIISIEMTDRDVIEKVALLMNVTAQSHDRSNPNWKPTFTARLRGRCAVELMTDIYPLMGARRKKQIEDAIACFRDSRTHLSDDQIATIRERSIAGQSMQKLASEFSVSYSTVKKIKYGTTNSRRGLYNG